MFLPHRKYFITEYRHLFKHFVENYSCSYLSGSFLRLILNYLGTIIIQGIWSNLAIMSIKHKLCEKLDNSNMISIFSEIKKRKRNSVE